MNRSSAAGEQESAFAASMSVGIGWFMISCEFAVRVHEIALS